MILMEILLQLQFQQLLHIHIQVPVILVSGINTFAFIVMKFMTEFVFDTQVLSIIILSNVCHFI